MSSHNSLVSTEIRWFIKAHEEDVIEDYIHYPWIQKPPLEKRIDRYLIPSGKNNPGVKWRMGDLEIKKSRLVKKLPRGSVRRYEKSSLELKLAPDNSQWVDIAKERWVWHFHFKGLSLFKSWEYQASNESCAVEAGFVQTIDQRFFTLCIECTGTPNLQLKRLLELYRELSAFYMKNRCFFNAKNSMDYAQWLTFLSPKFKMQLED